MVAPPAITSRYPNAHSQPQQLPKCPQPTAAATEMPTANPSSYRNAHSQPQQLPKTAATTECPVVAAILGSRCEGARPFR